MTSSRGLLAIALAALAGSVALAEPTGSTSYVVVLGDDVRPDAVPAVSRRVVGSMGPALVDVGVLFRHALRGFVVRLADEDRGRIAALALDPDVAYVAADRSLSLHGQYFQPGMERVRVRGHRLTNVNDIDDGNVDVDIAVLDSGIDAAHPDLIVHRSVSFVPGDPSAGDHFGHGTHMAGIAAAVDDGFGIHGVAPGARLWAVKVADQAGGIQLSWVLSGLDYVAAHADEIDVVNMSLGGPGPPDDGDCGLTAGDPLHQAICAVVDAGVVVVVSAGNQVPFGTDASLITPASYDEVITVSAVVESDGLGPGVAQGPATPAGVDNSFARMFSNYGWDVDIAAPGVDVLSTWPGGGFEVQTGTSAATAHVTGAAALWIVGNGKPIDRAGAIHVRDELVRLAFPQRGSDLGFTGDRETFAEPLLNVAALDPGVFDPVEPRLEADRPVYEYGVDETAIVSAFVRDGSGAPLAGLPSNAFRVFLAGEPWPVQFVESGRGHYALTVGIGGLLPGDHDLTALVRDVAGFERSAGCRIVIRSPEPRILIHDAAFFWPVMNADSFFSSNPLYLRLMNERGAPVIAPPASFATAFSGGGPELDWSLVGPSFLAGIDTGITYGAYETAVDDVHLLPSGNYVADISIEHGGLSDTATASFDVAYYEPQLVVVLTASASTRDFTQSIEPPPLALRADVRSEWMTGVVGLHYVVADPFVLEVDGHPVEGAEFVADQSAPGVYVAADVDVMGLATGDHRFVVRVTDGRGLTAASNAVTIEVLRAGAVCAAPLAAVGDADGDGDGVLDECDNCPTVANRSQRNAAAADASEAGLGDACRTVAGLRVSSSVADRPDFFTIQDAVNGANNESSEIRIEVLPGAGPYVENVVIDRDQAVRLVGRDRGSGPPVVEHDGTGEAIFELRTSADGSVALGNLVLRGEGVVAGRGGVVADGAGSTFLSDLRFEQLGFGASLRSGSHLVERIAVDGTVGSGVIVDDAELMLRHAELRGVDEGVRVFGSSGAARIESVLLVGTAAGNGVRVDESAGASVELRHATVTGFETAVSANAGNATVAHSILWGNETAVRGVGCSEIVWSDVEGANCGGTNLALDPLFANAAAGDFRLQGVSPLLDHGPDPRDLLAIPCRDLDGGPRLRDHDGENLAQIDPGAYERENADIVPGEVTGIAWTDRTTMEWIPVPGAVEYHVYRGALGSLREPRFGTCEDGLDAVRADALLTDRSVPAPGEGYVYQITIEDGSGAESTLGIGTCAERSNFDACP